MSRLLEADALWLQKEVNTPAEWEDSFALSESTGRFCVADGASSSARANVWAAQLTSAFIDDPLHPADSDALQPWLERQCTAFAEAGATPTASSAWYAHEIAARDAFATFLGVMIGTDASGQLILVAVAVGDSNAFVVRDSALVETWPLATAEDFGRHPELVSSNAAATQSTADGAQRWRVILHPGDNVLLLSDALAEWALQVSAAEPDVWSLLRDISQSDLVALVHDLRRADEIVNDDVTLVRCTVRAATP